MKKSTNIFAGLSEENLKKRKKVTQPRFVKPMLATLTKDYFSSKEWICEHKFDGERCFTYKKDGKVRLISRNNKGMNNEYPELVKAFEEQLADNFIIDGEIVALDKKGVSDFELLQGRINLKQQEKIETKQKNIKIYYRIFDIMYADSYDVRKLPLYARKDILKKLLNYNKIISYTQHKSAEHALTLFKKVCADHWEGLIVKKNDSEYVGIRSSDWLKFKCSIGQELVIGGYTDPEKSRTYFGALLVGYYDNKKLMYAGKVGTGYSQAVLKMLGTKMKKLEIQKCPFANYDKSTQHVHWIRPILVAEFEFANWTNAGRLRVGRYKGLRNDKAAYNVVKETAKAIGPKKKEKSSKKSRKK